MDPWFLYRWAGGTSGTARSASPPPAAAIIGARMDLETVVEDWLAETRKGRWEGRRRDEVKAREPHVYDRLRRAPHRFRYPEGEAMVEHQHRVRGALARGPLPALLVGHAGRSGSRSRSASTAARRRRARSASRTPSRSPSTSASCSTERGRARYGPPHPAKGPDPHPPDACQRDGRPGAPVGECAP